MIEGSEAMFEKQKSQDLLAFVAPFMESGEGFRGVKANLI